MMKQHCTVAAFRAAFIAALLLAFQTVGSAEDWRETSYQMKLVNQLDRPDGYCIDVPGSGNQVRFDMPLIAHNCKEGLYADEAVVHRKDGTIFFPVYEGCVTAMGLNNNAIPNIALMLKKCLVDEPFLSATRFQKFSVNEDQQVQLDDTDLCITVGSESRETYSSEHRWRSLYMQKCAVSQPELSHWKFVQPK